VKFGVEIDNKHYCVLRVLKIAYKTKFKNVAITFTNLWGYGDKFNIDNTAFQKDVAAKEMMIMTMVLITFLYICLLT
jgi:uncharacterized protein YhfF